LLSLAVIGAFSGYWLAWISGDKAQGVGWLERLISPLLLFVIAWALARSTFRTWQQGGIQWRETFYSIAALRRGQRLKF